MKTKLLPMLFAALLLIATTACAQFTDTSRSSLSIGLGGGRGNSAHSATGILKVEKNNFDGYLAGFAERTYVEEIYEARTYIGRAEGGYRNIQGWGGYGYFESEFNDDKNLFQNSLGYYLQAPAYHSERLDVSFGAGNWVARTQDLEALGIESYKPVSVGWRVHAEVEMGNLLMLIEYLPEISFDTYELRSKPHMSFDLGEIGDGVSIAFSISGVFSYKSNAEQFGVDRTQYSYGAGLDFLF